MRSPFAADRLPDGRRHYSREAVLARRALLAGLVVAGAGTAVGVEHLRDPDAPAPADPRATAAAVEGPR
ncbi:hypothetical protein GTR02_09525, partial [Kineococcus sp. R8]|uniref:hypothetical protein n=1 Tax=Kineococcus siccus TaxID=2696567 RepID=UPI00196B7A40